MTGPAKGTTGVFPGGTLSRASGRPLYAQLADILESRIRDTAPGARLPREDALVEQYGVSRVTVRRALAQMAQIGIVERRQGKGTFVASPAVNQTLGDGAKTIVEALAEKGIEPDVTVLGLDRVAPPPHVRAAFHGADAPVVRLRRLYAHAGCPIALVDLYVPLALSGVAQILAETGHRGETTYSVFETELQITIKEACHTIKTVRLDADVASALGMRQGDTGLVMDRITFGENGTVLEVMTYHYATERFQFEITLPRHERHFALKVAEG